MSWISWDKIAEAVKNAGSRQTVSVEIHEARTNNVEIVSKANTALTSRLPGIRFYVTANDNLLEIHREN